MNYNRHKNGVPPATKEHDFQTPLHVGTYMTFLIPIGCKTILEPTPGKGNLVKCLREAKRRFKVTAPDDYFLLPYDQQFDCVVMNPPFSGKYANLQNAPADIMKHQGMRVGYYFLTEAMRRSSNVIAIMPMFTIADSDTRINHLKEWGMRSLTQLSRSTFGSTRIQSVVIHLQKGYTGPTIYKLFPQELKLNHLI